MRDIIFEYGFESVNGIVKKVYHLHEISMIKSKCDVWNSLPIIYVRQYIGLTDKNGKKIFVGDRLTSDFHGKSELTVVFDFCGFKLKFDHKDSIRFSPSKNIVDGFEVIGSIYENKTTNEKRPN